MCRRREAYVWWQTWYILWLLCTEHKYNIYNNNNNYNHTYNNYNYYDNNSDHNQTYNNYKLTFYVYDELEFRNKLFVENKKFSRRSKLQIILFFIPLIFTLISPLSTSVYY